MSRSDAVSKPPANAGRRDDNPAPERLSSHGFGCAGYGAAVRRRLWPIIGLIVALATLAGLSAFSREPVYESSTTLLIDRGSPAEGPGLGPSGEAGSPPRVASPGWGPKAWCCVPTPVAERVADRLDLWRHPQLDPRQASLEPGPGQA